MRTAGKNDVEGVTVVYVCGRCDMLYREYTQIVQHLYWKHGTESFWCNKCLLKRWHYAEHKCYVLPYNESDVVQFEDDTPMEVDEPTPESAVYAHETESSTREMETPGSDTESSASDDETPEREYEPLIPEMVTPLPETDSSASGADLDSIIREYETFVREIETPTRVLESRVPEIETHIGEFDSAVRAFESPIFEFEAPVHQTESPESGYETCVREHPTQVFASNVAAASTASGSEVRVRESDFCLCGIHIEGATMIGCDDPECALQWYHIQCVGIVEPPEGDWFCPTCTRQRKLKKKKAKGHKRSRTSAG